ncbi:hypothetical protein [Niallia nealsonii]|nr:hypothetical protein [Niallia nealsonii]
MKWINNELESLRTLPSKGLPLITKNAGLLLWVKKEKVIIGIIKSRPS